MIPEAQNLSALAAKLERLEAGAQLDRDWLYV